MGTLMMKEGPFIFQGNDCVVWAFYVCLTTTGTTHLQGGKSLSGDPCGSNFCIESHQGDVPGIHFDKDVWP